MVAGLRSNFWPANFPILLIHWLPDGKVLAFTEVHPSTNGDIWMLPLEGEGKPEPFPANAY